MTKSNTQSKKKETRRVSQIKKGPTPLIIPLS